MRGRLLLGPLLLALTACGSGNAGGASVEASDVDAGTTPATRLPDSPDSLPEAVRVVVLGTSLTAGLGLSEESDRYTDRIQSMADSIGIAVVVSNAGVSGDTSAGGLRRLSWILETPLDVLVVELGANDGMRGHDPDALRENLTRIVERTRAARPETTIVLAGMQAPPNMGDRYTRRFRAVFPELAERYDLALVPFLLEGVAGVAELNQADGIHPTAEGHRIMAETVWEVLEPILRRKADERSEPSGG